MDTIENKAMEIKREFVDSVTGEKFYIDAPSANDIRDSDWQYSKTYTKSLVAGITTSAEMLDILMRRGIAGPEFEQRREELSEQLSFKIEKLNKTINLDEKRGAAMEVAGVREELFNWNQRLNGPMSNTCEQIADDARLEYLTSCIVCNNKNEKVWPEYTNFSKEKNQAFANRARFEVMLFLQGLESDFLEQTPEAQAIKEVEEKVQIEAEKAMKKLEKKETKNNKPNKK